MDTKAKTVPVTFGCLFLDTTFYRACNPQVGDTYRLGEETVKIEDIGEDFLIMLSKDHGNGTGLTYFYRNKLQWNEAVEKTLARGAVFMPNVMMSGPEDKENPSSSSRENCNT